MRKTVRDRRVDRIFGDIALGAEIIIPAAVFAERAALHFHLVGRLPAAQSGFPDAAHGLRIRRHHREDPQIMENVFRRDGFTPDTGFSESHVLGNFRAEVVTDHQHVEMFVDCIDGVGTRRIC